MKKLLTAALMLLLLGSVSAETVVKVTGNSVRLRTTPYITNNNIYCQVNAGTVLTYYDTMDDWYQVGYKGQVLYVSRDYASLSQRNTSTSSSGNGVVASSSASYRYVVVNNGIKNLRLRTGPSTNYPYLIWQNTGETVHVVGGTHLEYLGYTTNGFYKVRYMGEVCWISADYSHLMR